jgi:hypothetical protein
VGEATPARTISVHRFVKAWRDERVRVPVKSYSEREAVAN